MRTIILICVILICHSFGDLPFSVRFRETMMPICVTFFIFDLMEYGVKNIKFKD